MEDLGLARKDVERVAAQEVVDHDLDLGEGEAPATVVSLGSGTRKLANTTRTCSDGAR